MKKRLTVTVDADDGAHLTAEEWEARREAWFARWREDMRPADDVPDEVAEAWAARWRAWFSGELPPPSRSTHPRYRYLDEHIGKKYGIEWTDDDEALDADPPDGSDTKPTRRARPDGDWDAWLDRWLEQTRPLSRKFEPPTPDDDLRYQHYWYKYRLWEIGDDPVSATDGQQ